MYTPSKHSIFDDDESLTSKVLSSGYQYQVVNDRQQEVMHSLALGVSLDAPISYGSNGSSSSGPSPKPSPVPPGSGSSGPSSTTGNQPDNSGPSGTQPGQDTEGASPSTSSEGSTSGQSEDIQSFALEEKALLETLSEAVNDGIIDESESSGIVNNIGKHIRSLGSGTIKVAAPMLIQSSLNALTKQGKVNPIIEQKFTNNYSLVNHLDAEFSGIRNSLALGMRSK